jgi:hypothetical protein
MPLSHNVGISPGNVLTLSQASCVQTYGERNKSPVTQVGLCTDWTTVNTNAASAASAGVLQSPGTAVAPANNNAIRLDCGHAGTFVRLRMRYPVSTPTACTVRCFGFDGSHIRNNGNPPELGSTFNVLPKPEHLPDSLGNFSIVLTPDGVNDIRESATFAYTKTVIVPIQGNLEVICLVSSAGAATSTIEARVV